MARQAQPSGAACVVPAGGLARFGIKTAAGAPWVCS